MVLRHVGLTCSSEENSDKFYEDLLGLEKSGAKHLPASLSKSIFNLDSELVMINYQDEQVHFEIFVTGPMAETAGKLHTHVLKLITWKYSLKNATA